MILHSCISFMYLTDFKPVLINKIILLSTELIKDFPIPRFEAGVILQNLREQLTRFQSAPSRDQMMNKLDDYMNLPLPQVNQNVVKYYDFCQHCQYYTKFERKGISLEVLVYQLFELDFQREVDPELLIGYAVQGICGRNLHLR